MRVLLHDLGERGLARVPNMEAAGLAATLHEREHEAAMRAKMLARMLTAHATVLRRVRAHARLIRFDHLACPAHLPVRKIVRRVHRLADAMREEPRALERDAEGAVKLVG